jgi:hypothetical protein
MSLLFWYLPFMIMSGCFDTLCAGDGAATPKINRCECAPLYSTT